MVIIIDVADADIIVIVAVVDVVIGFFVGFGIRNRKSKGFSLLFILLLDNSMLTCTYIMKVRITQ